MMRFNKRASVAIAIVLLVVATLIISVTAFLYFSSKLSKSSYDFNAMMFSEDIYSHKEKINFHIQEMVNQASVSVNSEQEFIDNFNSRLSLYRFKDGSYVIKEFEQIPSQINLDNVKFEDLKFKLTLNLKIKETIKKDKVEVLNAEYNYKQDFSS